MNWDEKFAGMTKLVASWSKDKSTKVGAVIVGPDNDVRATGYNGFPRGANDYLPERHERPLKYSWAEHAERNAIYQAARTGVALDGCTLYSWADRPLGCCVDCSRAMVQSGIKVVVLCNGFDHEDPVWGENTRIAKQILKEGGVILRCYEC